MPKLEGMEHTFSRGAHRARSTRVSSQLAEINVVPLVDVMLVLLVIFMVAAPLMQQGFGVHLPQSKRQQPLSDVPITVTVPTTFRNDRRVRLGEEWVQLDFLPERVRQALSGRLTKDVILNGDGSVTLQELVTVMDRLKEGGVEKVGMKTEPPARERVP